MNFSILNSFKRAYYSNQSKKLFSLTLAAILVSGFGLVSFVFPIEVLAHDNNSCSYDVAFDGRTLDNESNTSTWSYTISSDDDCPDPSEWVWDTCMSLSLLKEVFVSATPEQDKVGFDGATGHYGVKWEEGSDFDWEEEGVTFAITIEGQPDIDAEGATAVIKAGHTGDQVHDGREIHFDLPVPGPICEDIPEEPTHTTTTIFAEKVVCEIEEFLPDWGNRVDGPDYIITDTALDYVNSSDGKCWLETEWEFQWGPFGQQIAGDHIGPAPENTGWNDFDTATSQETPAKVEIIDLADNLSKIWVRENLQEGYIPFANPPGSDLDSNSAELYCHDDIFHYDNYDYIRNPEPGETYWCVAFNALVSEPEPVCGNEIIEEGEQCDDGNTTDGDGCSAICEIEEEPTPEPDECEMRLTKIDDPDPVEPGDTLTYYLTLENIGTADCTGGGVLLKDYWDDMTNYDDSSQSPRSLTDDFAIWNFGVLEPDEIEQIELTMTVSEGAVCGSRLMNKAKFWSDQTGWSDWVYEYTDVECEPICGNNILEEGETCDDGNIEDGDGCSAICLLEEEPEPEPICGNNILEEGEQCDDGNIEDGDGCSAICEIEEEPEPEPEPICGNEITEEGEQCDDGNIEDGDGCSAICELEQEPTPESICGNEVVEEGEQCDDGNTEDGDGCSAICELEQEPEPNQCTIDEDEDGYYAEGETCGPLDCNDDDVEINPGVDEICDDQIDNNCDGLIDLEDSQCTDQGGGDNGNGGNGGGTTPPGGGGGGGGVVLNILNEQNGTTSTSTSQVSWETNIPSTSRVVYGTASHSVVTILGENYGYSSSSIEYDTNATLHVVMLSDLKSDTVYYWRAISSTSSTEVLGDELSFTTLDGTSSEPVQEEQEPPQGGTGGGGGGGGGTPSQPEPDPLEDIQEQIEDIQEQIEQIQQEIENMFPPAPEPTPEPEEPIVQVPVAPEESEDLVEIPIISESIAQEPSPEQPEEKGFIEFLLGRIGDLFVTFLASVNSAASSLVNGNELPCMPNWLVAVLIIFSAFEWTRAENKKIKGSKYLFYWALLLAAGMFLFYGSIYTCINIFIVIILGLLTLLVRWFAFQDQEEKTQKPLDFPGKHKKPSYLDWEKTTF